MEVRERTGPQFKWWSSPAGGQCERGGRGGGCGGCGGVGGAGSSLRSPF